MIILAIAPLHFFDCIPIDFNCPSFSAKKHGVITGSINFEKSIVLEYSFEERLYSKLLFCFLNSLFIASVISLFQKSYKDSSII